MCWKLPGASRRGASPFSWPFLLQSAPPVTPLANPWNVAVLWSSCFSVHIQHRHTPCTSRHVQKSTWEDTATHPKHRRHHRSSIPHYSTAALKTKKHNKQRITRDFHARAPFDELTFFHFCNWNTSYTCNLPRLFVSCCCTGWRRPCVETSRPLHYRNFICLYRVFV